ncbi:MAG: hypothetical protein ACREXU_09970 [Gammaproteobacteria bacterium]
MPDRSAAHQQHPVSLMDRVLRECEAMMSYAFASGASVPGEHVAMLERIAAERARYRAHPSVADEEPPSSEDSPVSGALSLAASSVQAAQVLSQIHASLTRIVAPATPRTILLLDQELRKGGLLRSLGAVPLVRHMMLAALICLCGLIATGVSPEVNEASVNMGLLKNSGFTLLLSILFLLCAAGVGASFSALFTANHYVSAGTFDPKYDPSYWVRFFLGLIAGVILTQLVSIEGSEAGHVLAQPTLALIGGFSANVVYRIIDRLVDAAESPFRADPRDVHAAEQSAAKVRYEQQLAETKARLAGILVQFQRRLDSGEDSAGLAQHIEKVLGDLVPQGIDSTNAGQPAGTKPAPLEPTPFPGKPPQVPRTVVGGQDADRGGPVEHR